MVLPGAAPGPGPARRALVAAAAVPVSALALACLALETEWQSSVHALMELERVESALPLRVGTIAAAVFAAVLTVARLFHLTVRAVSHRLQLFVPRRLAVAGVVVAAALFWSVIDGVLLRLVLQSLDVSFQRVDTLMEPDVQKPADPGRTGSAASLVAWKDLGRRGREFVSTGPTAGALRAFLGGDAVEPVRVYVGLGSAGSIEGRVRLALTELERVGAFERSVLVLVTPTGTGWIDPGALDAIEHLHRGDVASAAVQYSYLPSWLTLRRPITAPRRPERCSAWSTAAGRLCPATGAPGSTSTASASEPSTPSGRPTSTMSSPTRSRAPCGRVPPFAAGPGAPSPRSASRARRLGGPSSVTARSSASRTSTAGSTSRAPSGVRSGSSTCSTRATR